MRTIWKFELQSKDSESGEVKSAYGAAFCVTMPAGVQVIQTGIQIRSFGMCLTLWGVVPDTMATETVQRWFVAFPTGQAFPENNGKLSYIGVATDPMFQKPVFVFEILDYVPTPEKSAEGAVNEAPAAKPAKAPKISKKPKAQPKDEEDFAAGSD